MIVFVSLSCPSRQGWKDNLMKGCLFLNTKWLGLSIWNEIQIKQRRNFGYRKNNCDVAKKQHGHFPMPFFHRSPSPEMDENYGDNSVCPRAKHQASVRNEAMSWLSTAVWLNAETHYFWLSHVDWVTGLLNVFVRLCVSWLVWSQCQSTDAPSRGTSFAY